MGRCTLARDPGLRSLTILGVRVCVRVVCRARRRMDVQALQRLVADLLPLGPACKYEDFARSSNVKSI